MGFFDSLRNLRPKNITERLSSWVVDQGARFGLSTGMTPEETEAQLRDSGWSLLAEPISRIFERVQQSSDQFQYFSRLGLDQIPDANRMREASFLTDNFGYVVDYDVFNNQGEFMGTSTSRIDHPETISQEQLLGLLDETLLTNSGVLLSNMNNIRIKGALRSSNFSGS